jgi:hypothetical protein
LEWKQRNFIKSCGYNIKLKAKSWKLKDKVPLSILSPDLTQSSPDRRGEDQEAAESWMGCVILGTCPPSMRGGMPANAGRGS